MAILSRPRYAVLAAAAVLAAIGAGLPAAAPALASAPAGGTAPAVPRAAAGVPASALARPALPGGQEYVCPAPVRPGQMECASIIAAPGTGQAGTATGVPGYGPQALRSAYRLAAATRRGGHGTTVAIVDAYSDPSAVADLAVYRRHFGLGRCPKSNGCLRIVNQNGKSSPLPKPNSGWAVEESLDLDMVSAICPRCRILLVQASSPTIADLGSAVRTAIRLGARYVSNSWSGAEVPGFVPGAAGSRRYFDHPGVVLDFAAGDTGYGAAYPADLGYVTSVGGTSLRRAPGTGRGWIESAWGTPTGGPGTGSGCSAIEVKPSWQVADASAPNGCLNRTETDVSAVADPATGVAVYDTYQFSGWHQVGGTSAATPIITATYALAGRPAARTYPSQYPYLRPGLLFGVRSGANGICEPNRQYLCNAAHSLHGYNGPTGLGTPDGVGAFRAVSGHHVTLVDPGTQALSAGARFRLVLTALDTARVADGLRFSASGLPRGLSIRRQPHSTNAIITGTLPKRPGRFEVTVRAADGAARASTRFVIVGVRSLTLGQPPAGPLSLNQQKDCLTAPIGSGRPARIRPCSTGSSQTWAYRSTGGPNWTGQLISGGRCLNVSGTQAMVGRCGSSAAQRWQYQALGRLLNVATGKCLSVRTLTAGAAARVTRCNFGVFQAWRLPPAQFVYGQSARCLTGPSATTDAGTPVTLSGCGQNSAAQQWSLGADALVSNGAGLCLDVTGGTTGNGLDGTRVIATYCDANSSSQAWLPAGHGQLWSLFAHRCLTGTAAGGLVLGDCYGEPQQIWAIN
ncbi:MAG: ricin-type beta-trefoil lectin domain protein [Streptosporangiaceae bacterium]